MCELASLTHALDERTLTCNVVMVPALPKPWRSFAEMRTISSNLTPLLPKTADFTLHLGVVPATRANSGAPLEILVIGDPAPSLPVARVRLIGVLESDRTEKGRTRRTDHIVGMVDGSRQFMAAREIADLGKERLDALSKAWSAHNHQRVASFQVVASTGAAEALRLVKDYIVRDPALTHSRHYMRSNNALRR